MRRLRHLLLVLMLPLLTSACTLRYAHTSFTDPALNEAKGVAVEGGIRFWDGTLGGQRADVSLMGAYQRFDFFTDAATSHVEARARWFPLGGGAFDPFLGGGLGIYRLNATETVLTCRGRSICLSGPNQRRGNATGLTPHVVAGSEFGLGDSPFGLVAAISREFGGFDLAWNLDVWRMSAGVSYRPRQ